MEWERGRYKMDEALGGHYYFGSNGVYWKKGKRRVEAIRFFLISPSWSPPNILKINAIIEMERAQKRRERIPHHFQEDRILRRGASLSYSTYLKAYDTLFHQKR